MMKKAAIFALIFVSIQANCQKKFGILAGVSNPVLTSGVARQVTGDFGLKPQVSAFYEIGLTRNIHFRPRLMFTQQGGKVFEGYSGGFFDYQDYVLNYISVPLDIKFWNKVYVVIGPQAGVLISSNVPSSYDEVIRSHTDFGANLALGVRIHKISLELGVYQGFTSVIEDGAGFNHDVYHNAAARFSIGWYIL